MQDHHFHVILNTKAGTAMALGLTSETLAERFTSAGLSFDIDANDDEPLDARIARALSGPADTIVAAGGDGTVTAIAEALLDTDKTLAVLPLGTFNALAKDLHVPLDIEHAITALKSMETRLIDVAHVNTKLFLHNVLIGVIPGIAVGRELVRSQPTPVAWLGFGRFMLRRLSRARRMAVGITTDAGARVERLQAIAVANNSYDQKLGGILTRKRIDRGTLTLYTLKSLTWFDAIRLSAEMIAGRWREDDVISIEPTQTVTLALKKPNVLVTIDGEVMTLNTPLEFTIRPQSLSVLAVPTETPVSDQAPPDLAAIEA